MYSFPLVSVVMAAYNAEQYIEAAIRSILDQSHEALEVIVVNDGSKDNTAAIVSNINDPRVFLINQENAGQDSALNNGFLQSKGDYIKFMDADDIIGSETIEIQTAALKKYPNKIAYGEWYRFFNEEPSENDITDFLPYWKDSKPLDFLLADQDGPMLQCAIMLIPRQIIEKAGLWNEELILYNDTEFFTRILLNSAGIVFTKGARLFYRSGLEGSLTSANQRRSFESTYTAINLIAKQLLARENSKRVRENLANMYFRRRYDLYPGFPDLAKKYQAKIEQYGGGNLKIKSGKIYNLLDAVFGWKIAKKFKLLYQKR